MSEEDLALETPEDVVIDDISEETKQEAEEEDEYEKLYRKVQKKVQKRIDKLVYERETEKEARKRETEELRAELEALKQAQKQHQEDKQTSSLEQKRRELLERRKESLEIGDYDAVNTIDDELMDIKLQAHKKPDPVKPEPKQAEEPEPEVNEALAEWQSRNRWVFDPKHKSRLDKANEILAQVLEDGYSIDETDTYVELEKRLKRESPPPTPVPDRGTAGNDKRFTEQDRKDMIAWGFDPNDVKARQLWIKNKG